MVSFAIILWMVGSNVSGARFPNSVPKSVTVKGETALAWLKVLGLEPKAPHQLSLALHNNEVHARNIRTGNEASTTSISNQISWDPLTQTLTLSGDWLNQRTGSFRDLPHYTFGSGFIASDFTNALGWGEILKGHGFPRAEEPRPKDGAVLDKTFSGSSKPRLTVIIYRMESYEEANKGKPGYMVSIGIDE